MLKESILDTEVFKPWRDNPDKLKVDLYKDCFDVRIEAVGTINITPKDVDTHFPLEFNGIQDDFLVTSGYITTGSPAGGTIRFLFSEGKSNERTESDW